MELSRSSLVPWNTQLVVDNQKENPENVDFVSNFFFPTFFLFCFFSSCSLPLPSLVRVLRLFDDANETCVCVSLGTLQRSVLMTHAVARAWLIRSTRAHTQTHIHIYTHTHTWKKVTMSTTRMWVCRRGFRKKGVGGRIYCIFTFFFLTWLLDESFLLSFSVG